MAEVPARTIDVPGIGEPAPTFEAITTQGVIRLEAYKGKWLILFSHPADFTPVCTTELIELARLQPEFEKRGIALLGLSVDSISSHIAWIRNIEEKMGVKITFPLVADLDKFISLDYGMIHPGRSKNVTVRSVFIIDAHQVIRAILHYPLELGRNIDEILRIADSLQIADEYSVVIPANWKPGERVIVPPPDTQEAVEARIKENLECTDWYLCKKDLEPK